MIDTKEIVREYWPWILGGVGGVYLILKLRGHKTSAPVSNVGSYLRANAAMSAVNSRNTAQADQFALAQQQLSNSASIAKTAALGTSAKQIGASVSSIIAAQSILPAETINAVSAGHQAALRDAAATAATGFLSLPGDIKSSAQLINASYQPFAQYSHAISSMGQIESSSGAKQISAVGNTGANATNSAAQAASASSSASTSANAASSQSTAQEVGTAAAIAMMFL